MRTISNLFGVGKSTACKFFNEVCTSIREHIMPKYVRMPGGDRLARIIHTLECQAGLLQVGGAIDGSHIPFKAPLEDPDAYYNRKGFHSIVLQGVVDCFLNFTDIFIGYPGRVHEYYQTVGYSCCLSCRNCYSQRN